MEQPRTAQISLGDVKQAAAAVEALAGLLRKGVPADLSQEMVFRMENLAAETPLFDRIDEGRWDNDARNAVADSLYSLRTRLVDAAYGDEGFEGL